MILYFSGIGFPPERAFKETNLMMSFIHSVKKPQKRFRLVYKIRKREKRNKK